MTNDTTTIEITEDQRDELKALKAHDRESYKAVICRLLSGTDAEIQTAADVGFDDLRDQLDRIESAAKEATNAAQSAEREVGELQR